MNTGNDQLETLIGSELHDRADEIDGRWLSLADVTGRARTIRRHRRIGAGLGVAAALAIVVPLGMTVGGSPDSQRDLEPAAPREVVRTTLTTEGLARGDSPRIEYFTSDGVVLPESGLQPLEDSWQALVPNEAGGGWLALSPSKDEVVDLTDDFTRDFSRAVTQTFVSSPDRSTVAWTLVDTDGQTLELLSMTDPTVGEAWTFPRSPQVDAVDFVGERSLLFQSQGTKGGEIGIAHEDGSTSMFEGDWVKAISANPETGVVAVQTRSNQDASGCFGVVDPALSTATTTWETCDYSLGAFSPDGRYVLASDAYQSGLGPSSLSVLDARTGDLVTSFEPERTTQVALVGVAWESADTFVAVAVQGMNHMIVRLGVDGTLESTVEAVEGDPFGDLAFHLGADRLRSF